MNKLAVFVITLFALALALFIAGMCWVFGLVVGTSDIRKQTCEQYERDGALPKGSCSCTEKLFERWDMSYDWMDSCAILDHKKGIK